MIFLRVPSRYMARRIAAQATVLLLLALVAAWLLSNATTNLKASGIDLDFGFLRSAASFDIGESLLPFDSGQSILRAFGAGILNTMAVSALSIVLATILGVVVGVARLSTNGLVVRLATGYVETIRNAPLLLQLLFWHTLFTHALPPARAGWKALGCVFLTNRGLFVPALLDRGWLAAGIAVGVIFCAAAWPWRSTIGDRRRLAVGGVALATFAAAVAMAQLARGPMLACPSLQGFNIRGGQTLSPEFVSLWLALSIYGSSYISEIVRGSIIAVPRGQVQAAQALGLGPFPALWLVVLPQALRSMIPPVTSQYLNILKSSSLAVAVGYPDLMRVSVVTTSQTGHAIECMVIVMAVYLSISLLIAAFMNAYNRRKLATSPR